MGIRATDSRAGVPPAPSTNPLPVHPMCGNGPQHPPGRDLRSTPERGRGAPGSRSECSQSVGSCSESSRTGEWVTMSTGRVPRSQTGCRGYLGGNTVPVVGTANVRTHQGTGEVDTGCCWRVSLLIELLYVKTGVNFGETQFWLPGCAVARSFFHFLRPSQSWLLARPRAGVCPRCTGDSAPSWDGGTAAHTTAIERQQC